MSDIYVATKTATFTFQGRRVFVTAGKTTVRQGHPMLDEFPTLFEPLKVTYDTDRPEVERATANPGERRTVTKRGGVKPKGARPEPSNEGPTQGLTTGSIETR